jgi:hypothetical protein
VIFYNPQVSSAVFADAGLGQGRRLYMLDMTHGPVTMGTYKYNGVVKNEDGIRSCGYQLVTLRTLLASAGLLTQVLWPRFKG